MQETCVQSLGWEDPLEKRMATTPVFFPREFHGQRSLAGYSPWGCKESDSTQQLTHKHVRIATTELFVFSCYFKSLLSIL